VHGLGVGLLENSTEDMIHPSSMSLRVPHTEYRLKQDRCSWTFNEQLATLSQMQDTNKTKTWFCYWQGNIIYYFVHQWLFVCMICIKKAVLQGTSALLTVIYILIQQTRLWGARISVPADKMVIFILIKSQFCMYAKHLQNHFSLIILSLLLLPFAHIWSW